MAFERQIALGLGQFEEGIEQAECLDIAGLAMARAPDQKPQSRRGPQQHFPGIGDHEAADGGSENDQPFGRLEQRVHRAAIEKEAAQHRDDDDSRADDHQHGSLKRSG